MKCLFCGNEDLSLIRKTEIFNREIFKTEYKKDIHKELLNIYICNHCGYGFCDNQFDEETIEEYYKNFEYTNPFDGLSISSWFDRNLSVIKNKLNKDAMIVEIGCSDGFFMNKLQSAGYTNIMGIEASEHAKKGIERGFNIKNIFFTEETIKEYSLFEKSSVDAFVLLHTFEHFLNPFVIFETMCMYLKDTGFIFIETPNFSSFALGHISYFSWFFYEKMAEKYNMKIVEVIDDNENITVVFTKKNNNQYKELSCPYSINQLKERVKNNINSKELFYNNIIEEIKNAVCKSNKVLIWGTKIVAANIVSAIPDIENLVGKELDAMGGKVIIPVDSYKSRKGYILKNITKPTVCPEDIKDSYYDTVIVTTEFINEVKKTMHEYNITCNNIIHAVNV